MKTVSTIVKVLTALAAVAGIIYVVATYGDQIVAWAKKLLGGGCCKSCCKDAPEADAPTADADVEKSDAPESAEAPESAQDAPSVQAEESDFEA